MSYLDHDFKKAKSASKVMIPAGPFLKKKVTETVNLISSIVGSTLGPNGKTILIERSEPGIPPFLSKDGVTAIRSLCFEDPAKQCILEVYREAASRTVQLAGDGTTTSTLLASSILNKLNEYLDKNTKISSQYAARELVKYTNDVIVPYLDKSALKVNLNNYNDLLLKVATISANGDSELASKVLEAFNMVGDGGHINIQEEPGYGTIEVLKESGYPFDRGFEASLGMFANEYINDRENNRIILDNPNFILIDGKVLELNQIIQFLQLLEVEFHKGLMSPNVVLIAHGFGKEAVASLAKFWKLENALKILPVVTPADMLVNSQYDFLLDVAAWTGGKIFNPLTNPIYAAVPGDLGKGAKSFESQRYKSVIHGVSNEDTTIKRVKELRIQADRPESTKLANMILTERAGRLSGGIATFKIRCASEAESREIRDRADDAICSVRAAVKHGVLPGGGRCLLDISTLAAASESEIIREVLAPALIQPIFTILSNCGLVTSEITTVISRLLEEPQNVYDAAKTVFGNPLDLGLIDSQLAVKESLRAAVSVSTLLSTLGGVVVFGRDDGLETSQALSHLSTQKDLMEADSDSED